MSIEYPYRAVFFGQKYSIEGWRGRKLVTNKGSIFVQHIYTDWQIQNQRLFEVAAIQADGNGGWLVNGLPLSSLVSLPFGERFAGIKDDEDLRVFEDAILAVAWFDRSGNASKTAALLDLVLRFWKEAVISDAKPKTDEKSPDVSSDFWQSLGQAIQKPLLDYQIAMDTARSYNEVFLPCWSEPVWLTEFRLDTKNKKNSTTPKQIEVAKDAPQISQAAKTASVEVAPAPKKIAQKKAQASAPPAPEYFFSYKAAAEYIGRTARTITNWKRDGWLKVEKTGKKVRIARTDLDKCKNRE